METCPSFKSGHLPAEEDVKRLRTLSAPHVESFNYFLEVGLQAGIQDIEPAELDIVDRKNYVDWNELDTNETTLLRYWVENVKVAQPVKSTSGNTTRLLPRECRERGLPYAAPITGTFCYNVISRRNGVEMPSKTVKIAKTFGNMPIMVMSKGCHLDGMSPGSLMKLKEEQTEFGGYFIVGGIERCVRLLQVPRRNHPTAIQRNSYKNRGSTYTNLGVAMKCSRWNGDQSSITNTLHYLTTGGATLRFVVRKQESLVPVILILRALSGPESGTGTADAAGGFGISITDEELYARVVQGDNTNTFLVARAALLLQDARARYGTINTPDECLAFIGARFRRLAFKSNTTSDVDIGHFVIRNFVLIHLQKYEDKLEGLLLMLRKLYSFAAGDSCVDNADSLQNQEILLPGHLMSTFVKEKFEECLQSMRLALLIDMRKDFAKMSAKLNDAKWWGPFVDRHSGKAGGGIGKKVQHFLSTGNIVSTSGLDLMQISGYTIVAEKLNFLRYCAHFRSVHRGQFFLEMKTTAVRKLLPDQWGFLCPVHTPDGGPCGLLSHLSLKANVMAYPSSLSDPGLTDIEELLISLGVAPVGAGGHRGDGRAVSSHTQLPVCLNGRVIGGGSPALCKKIASHLRSLKVEEPPVVPPTLEVALVPPGSRGSPYPGLYLFTCAARLVRPVLQRRTGKTEMIGPLEQGFMDIACLDQDIREGISTHQELDATNMLSLIANLTPFSDQNQSPRNMYQCQMGKQTMGTPCHALPYRSDNKLYRLQTPQAPLVQTAIHGQYKMDEYPNGTNAVVGKFASLKVAMVGPVAHLQIMQFHSRTELHGF
jgi:DNA-directed RNA polymerase I subunit RPA2